jgi:hypothetical protein
MKNPGLPLKLMLLLSTNFLALTATLRAEAPPSAAETRAARTPSGTRTRPQVIYRVRPASNYAATLHSQEKTEPNELPIDSSMPASLQHSRENANAAAAEARARQEAAGRHRSSPRPRIQKKQMMRAPMSVKSKSHGNGNKGHKH